MARTCCSPVGSGGRRGSGVGDGEGSEASRAVAYDLLATARWYAEDPLGAIVDAESAERLAIRADVPALVLRIQATRACFLAASGRYVPARELLDRVERRGGLAHADEAAALCRIAEALLSADADDPGAARRSSSRSRSTVGPSGVALWTAALSTALGLPSEHVEDGDDHDEGDAGLSRAGQRVEPPPSTSTAARPPLRGSGRICPHGGVPRNRRW